MRQMRQNHFVQFRPKWAIFSDFTEIGRATENAEMLKSQKMCQKCQTVEKR